MAVRYTLVSDQKNQEVQVSRNRQSTQQTQGNALVITGQLNKTKAKEASEVFAQGIRPMTKQLGGILSTVEMHSDNTGHAVYAIQFESNQALEQARQRGDLQEQLDRLQTIVGVKNTETWTIDSES